MSSSVRTQVVVSQHVGCVMVKMTAVTRLMSKTALHAVVISLFISNFKRKTICLQKETFTSSMHFVPKMSTFFVTIVSYIKMQNTNCPALTRSDQQHNPCLGETLYMPAYSMFLCLQRADPMSSSVRTQVIASQHVGCVTVKMTAETIPMNKTAPVVRPPVSLSLVTTLLLRAPL